MDREHQRRVREQVERRSDEVVRMAQEHYLLSVALGGGGSWMRGERPVCFV